VAQPSWLPAGSCRLEALETRTTAHGPGAIFNPALGLAFTERAPLINREDCDRSDHENGPGYKVFI
jgi:hypothetical protein